MSSAGGRDGVTGSDDRTEGGDIALKSEAKRRDGIGEVRRARGSKAKQGKAKQCEQSESNRASHTETRSRGRLRLADWQNDKLAGQVGHLLCGTGQGWTGHRTLGWRSSETKVKSCL